MVEYVKYYCVVVLFISDCISVLVVVNVMMVVRIEMYCVVVL